MLKVLKPKQLTSLDGQAILTMKAIADINNVLWLKMSDGQDFCCMPESFLRGASYEVKNEVEKAVIEAGWQWEPYRKVESGWGVCVTYWIHRKGVTPWWKQKR